MPLDTNRRRPPTVRAILAASALASALTACGGPAPATPTRATPTPATSASAVGAPGMLHLTTSPAYDQDRVRLAYVFAGTRIEGESIDDGVEVIVNRSFPPGIVRVLYDDRACDGSVLIDSNMETDAVLDIGPTACGVSTTTTHQAGSIRHAELPTTASVGALLPFGVPSVFVIRSLDSPGASPIAEVAVDHPPWEAAQVSLRPGRYEVSVLLGDLVLAKDELDLERGEDRVANLRVLPPDVPRDCGEVDATACEAAISAAYGHGLFIEGATTVSAVSVRPTRYTACDAVITPQFDLIFQLVNPTGEVAVTVGGYADGRLAACTY